MAYHPACNRNRPVRIRRPDVGALLVGLITILLCDMAVNKYDKSETHYHDEP